MFAALLDMYDYLRSHPAADCGLGGPGMMSAIVNRNGGLQKGGLLEFVEPELILERMEDCVNPDLLDLREPEDLGYILRTPALPQRSCCMRRCASGCRAEGTRKRNHCVEGTGK